VIFSLIKLFSRPKVKEKGLMFWFGFIQHILLVPTKGKGAEKKNKTKGKVKSLALKFTFSCKINFFLREMLIGTFEVLVNETNIKILHWELMISRMFYFIKVKKSLFLIKNFYF